MVDAGGGGARVCAHLLHSFNDALHTLLLPALSACYPEAAREASRLRVLDCFLVRYDAAKQASLPTHTDQSRLSFTIALNEPSEYEGGGTWFRGLGRAVDAPAAGHAVLFPGRVEHGGHPISKGVRYIIVLCAAPPRKRIASNTAPPCVVVRVSNHSLLPEGSAASLAW